MDATINIKEAFEKTELAGGNLAEFSNENWKTFSGLGIPALKHEEWRYTKIKNLFNTEMLIETEGASVDSNLINSLLLPLSANANNIIFLNGRYRRDLSTILTTEDALVIKPLEQASGDEDADFVNPIIMYLFYSFYSSPKKTIPFKIFKKLTFTLHKMENIPQNHMFRYS